MFDRNPFTVRRNFWHFLYEVKHRNDMGLITWLWIDALCNDQLRFDERSHQVAMMDRIYSRATKVIVWLGESTLHIQKAMRKMTTPYSSFSFGKSYERELTEQHWLRNREGIAALCEKKYWTRVWVVQEYAFARSVEIWCGTDWMSGLTLAWLLENRWKCMEEASAEE
jgi:hypothetical protein